jgi:hypothetical protein
MFESLQDESILRQAFRHARHVIQYHRQGRIDCVDGFDVAVTRKSSNQAIRTHRLAHANYFGEIAASAESDQVVDLQLRHIETGQALSQAKGLRSALSRMRFTMTQCRWSNPPHTLLYAQVAAGHFRGLFFPQHGQNGRSDILQCPVRP